MLRIDTDRLWGSLVEMGQAGKAELGINRLALGDGDRAARDLFTSWLREEGAEVRVDGIGNIFGIRKGSDHTLPPVMVGSHLDSVKEAGIFDGALGVLAGLEAMRTLNQQGIETSRDLIVASFTNEEGARFQPDMLGSMVHTGALDIESAWKAKDDEGISVRDELDRIGYLGNETLEAGYYLELHVEQGPILYNEGLEVGVVEGIQGMAWWDGEYMGEANHAGTTPLAMRKDALLAASDLCVKLRETAMMLGGGSVATMGRLHPKPDVRNVIPGAAWFTVDFRQYEPGLYERGKRTVTDLIHTIAEKNGLEYTLKETVDAKPVRFNKDMVKLVEAKTKELGLSYRVMHSGAGHDAQFLCSKCPTAMIFVPSRNGISHSPHEKTRKDDCVNGANILLNCVNDLGNRC